MKIILWLRVCLGGEIREEGPYYWACACAYILTLLTPISTVETSYYNIVPSEKSSVQPLGCQLGYLFNNCSRSPPTPAVPVGLGIIFQFASPKVSSVYFPFLFISISSWIALPLLLLYPPFLFYLYCVYRFLFLHSLFLPLFQFLLESIRPYLSASFFYPSNCFTLKRFLKVTLQRPRHFLTHVHITVAAVSATTASSTIAHR